MIDPLNFYQKIDDEKLQQVDECRLSNWPETGMVCPVPTQYQDDLHVLMPMSYQNELHVPVQQLACNVLPLVKQYSYDVAKTNLKIMENRNILCDKLNYEKEKERLKEKNDSRRGMSSVEVYQDTLGRLIYAQVDADEEIIVSKTLSNVVNFSSTFYTSEWPEKHSVLAVRWDGLDGCIYMENGGDGISSRKFLQKLKGKGMAFRISKRYEKAVADAILFYSLNNAEEYEIPFCFGWNVMMNGRWHCAKFGDITMKEVLNYV